MPTKRKTPAKPKPSVRNTFAVIKEQITASERKQGVVAKGRLPSQASYNGRRAFVRLFMWKSTEHMLRVHKGQPEGTKAFFFPLGYSSTKIGEAHFCLEWAELEVVAHELTHALVHRITMLGPSAVDIIAQRETGDRGYGNRGKFYAGRADEEIAYEMGRWVFNAYLWAVTVLRKRGLV